jgi:hypothetical protein
MISNGPVYIKTTTGELVSTISIAASATGYSEAFELIDLNDFSVEYKAACTGIPNVKLQIQQRASESVDWATPDNMADIKGSLVDKNQHLAKLAIVPARYIRIKAVEQTTSVDDTVITIRIVGQKKYPA